MLRRWPNRSFRGVHIIGKDCGVIAEGVAQFVNRILAAAGVAILAWGEQGKVHGVFLKSHEILVDFVVLVG